MSTNLQTSEVKLRLVHAAIQAGNLPAVRGFLDGGIDVNGHNPLNGDTLLATAAFYGQHDMVDFLIVRGAAVNLCCMPMQESGMTSSCPPLMSCFRDPLMIERLLGHGADPDLQDGRDLSSVLHTAARFNCAPSVLLLLRRGAQRELRNRKGLTPLQEARECGATDVVDAWQAYEAAELAEAAIRRGDVVEAKPL